jgi:uncharacterized protein with HEPN domain
MSQHDPEKYLFDMLDSCSFLLEFTQNKTVQDYQRDRAFRSALQRELQIIGEALMRLEREYPEWAEKIPEYRHIIGFRHILVHGYDQLNPETVWNIVETKLLGLKEQVESLLDTGT